MDDQWNAIDGMFMDDVWTIQFKKKNYFFTHTHIYICIQNNFFKTNTNTLKKPLKNFFTFFDFTCTRTHDR